MRIISSFRDYYDCMQAYYRDDLVYIREKKQITNEKYPSDISFFLSQKISNKNHSTELRADYIYAKCVIGFCGKEYTCYNICKSTDRKIGAVCFNESDIKKKLSRRF